MKQTPRYRREKRTALLLAAVCAVLAVIYALLCITPRRQTQTAVQSALLNPGHSGAVSHIEVTEPGGARLRLDSYGGGVWLGSSGSESEAMRFPAASISDCIKNFTSIRTLYVLSRTSADAAAYDLDEVQAAAVVFSDSQGTALSAIFFGSLNHTGQRIRLRTKDGETVYETEDDFSAYLSAQARRWADMHLVPQSITGSLSENDVQRITVTDKDGNGVRSIAGGSSELAEAAHLLLSLRGADIVPVSHAGKLLFTVRLDAGDGSAITLSVHTDLRQQEQYCITAHVQGTDAWPPGRLEAARGMDYALTVSAWTYNRLRESLF